MIIVYFITEEEYPDELGTEEQNDDSLMEEVTITYPCSEFTPSATPYHEKNENENSHLDLDDEMKISPVKFYYEHEDPGQYSIGNTPDNNDQDMSPSTHRAFSSSLKEEENKLSIIPEGRINDMDTNFDEEHEDKISTYIDRSDIKDASDSSLKSDIDEKVTKYMSDIEVSKLNATTEIKLTATEAKRELENITCQSDEKMRFVSEEMKLMTDNSRTAIQEVSKKVDEVESLISNAKVDIDNKKNECISLHTETKVLVENTKEYVKDIQKVKSEVTIISTELKEFHLQSRTEIKTIVSEQTAAISKEVIEAKIIAEEAKSIAEKAEEESKLAKQLVESTSMKMITSCEEIKGEVNEAKMIAEEAKSIAKEAKLALEEVRSASVAAEERSYTVLSEARSISVAAKAEALDLVQKITVIDSELDAAASVYSHTNKN